MPHEWRALVSAVSRHMPALFTRLLEVVDIVFGPKQVVKHVLLAATAQCIIVGVHRLSMGIDFAWSLVHRKSAEKRALTWRMQQATDFFAWRRIAEELDDMLGNTEWIEEDSSPLYDWRVLSRRAAQIQHMLYSRDTFGLMFRLRGAISRDQYGMQNHGLFSRALSGTKRLIQQYHDCVTTALQFIADKDPDSEVPTDAKLAFFNETRHCYGRTALLLSGGAYLGFYHIGIVKELHDRGLLPRVISGASAGSLIAAAVGVRNDEELDALNEYTIPRLDHFLHDWEIPGPSAKWLSRRYLERIIPEKYHYLVSFFFGVLVDRRSFIKLDTNRLVEVTKENCGELTFQEAFDRTGRIINITVAPVNNYDPPRLLNYLTAPHVCVWSAAIASCAIPGVFDSVPLIVREPDGVFTEEHVWTRQGPAPSSGGGDDTLVIDRVRYSDGSVESDLPMEQLAELFNINHFIVSQVNPHSPFLSSLTADASVWSHWSYTFIAGTLRFLKTQIRSYVRNLVDLVVYRAIAPSWSSRRGVIQALTQDYTGRDSDITVTPWMQHLSLPKAIASTIKNPSRNEIKDIILTSRRSLWPHIARIEARCRVEMTLDKCVQKLRVQMMKENLHRDDSSVCSVDSGTTNSSYTSRAILTLSGLSVSDPVRGTEELSSDFLGKERGSTATFLKDFGDMLIQDTCESSDDMGRDGKTCVPVMTRTTSDPQGGLCSDNSTSGSRIRSSASCGDVKIEGESKSTNVMDSSQRFVRKGSMANFYYQHNASSNSLSSK